MQGCFYTSSQLKDGGAGEELGPFCHECVVCFVCTPFSTPQVSLTVGASAPGEICVVMSKHRDRLGDPVVYYLGPVASFSHQAAINAFDSQSPSLQPKSTFADILACVQQNDGKDASRNGPEYGVVPFENSSNGSVVQSLDLLADRKGEYPDVMVCGEYYLPVHHCLLVSSNSDAGATAINVDHLASLKGRLETISQLYTHPQVWGQCTRFLGQHMRDVEKIDVGSTSLAAQKVKLEGRGRGAAIASNLAADVNNLSVIAENIEDEGSNTTRFFIIRHRHSLGGKKSSGGMDGEDADSQVAKWKSLFSFTIDHESPGALADALAVFKAFGFNLTSIYTRPSREIPWHYIFFVEAAELSTASTLTNQLRMLQDLQKYTRRLRNLGRWKDQAHQMDEQQSR